MNYPETLQWMFSQLPMYQQQGASAYKEDLTNTILLSDYLGNPEKGMQFIHVAGTNGKGSTSHMLASILQEAGYKVGLYTSPHLKDFRERIKINGKDISESFVCEFMNTHKAFFEKNQLSFFEMTVGLAFDYFKKEQTDIAIIETGMGGRLDSTNIITPLLSVITNIGLDHTQFLGNTIPLIAAEKAGIIKPGIPVVIGEYTAETKVVFENKANSCNAPIFFASDLIDETKPSDLLGDYQQYNKKTVLQAIRVLRDLDLFTISEKDIDSGLMNVVKNTGLQGRWQQLGLAPKIICDTAHNKHGLEIVMKQILNEKFDQLHMVIGMVNDKNLDEVLPLFPEKAKYYFCKPNVPRGMDVSVLQEKAAVYHRVGSAFDSVSEAYVAAVAAAEKADLIYVGGSTFVVAEIL
ncbi:bifunctional folylpolyglutamate synthase/dihydrofolate synthase [Flavobacterium kingsejongi]|uniref:Dihydrofolate synthase/folylpolyglutamate synthase n=1 Tax=Flavobacterium kingsejongi TaxID=1678728 RepID=A0A2S1LN79_9FLAO|nr:folylpolyglutamate synthase/dihydrofolate synthase family protein [Flavobacterium kingsejongi]AWG25205.1 tetrahydrofolate synthase [Flavobacterium kingsejongi]